MFDSTSSTMTLFRYYPDKTEPMAVYEVGGKTATLAIWYSSQSMEYIIPLSDEFFLNTQELTLMSYPITDHVAQFSVQVIYNLWVL